MVRFYEFKTNSGSPTERLEAKFETLSDARSVNYCRLSSKDFALFSLFVGPVLFLLYFAFCPVVILII